MAGGGSGRAQAEIWSGPMLEGGFLGPSLQVVEFEVGCIVVEGC